MRRRVGPAVSSLAALGTILWPGAAEAAWSSGGSGNGAGSATVMPSGVTPTARVSGTDVTVIWPSAAFPNGDAVGGYVITRSDAVTGSQAVVGAGCSGVVTGTSCIEHSVPPGNWIYTDTPVQFSWFGPSSPPSNQVTVS